MPVIKILSIAFLLSLPSIWLFHADPSLKYNMNDTAYRWIGQKIYDPAAKIDTVFMGTSQIWTAVNTQQINTKHPGQKSYNFGSNWHGRHARYVVLRDLLEEKKVKRVVLEVAEKEPDLSHRYSRYLGGFKDYSFLHLAKVNHLKPRDVLQLSPLYKSWVGETFGYLLSLPVKGYYYAGKGLVGLGFEGDDFEERDERYGYRVVHQSLELAEANAKKLAARAPIYSKVARTDVASNDFYVRRIAELCNEKGAELFFLFVPRRNAPAPGPAYKNLLAQLGTLVELPMDELYDHRLWRDYLHLDEEGAAVFTHRLLKSSLYANH